LTISVYFIRSGLIVYFLRLVWLKWQKNKFVSRRSFALRAN